MVGFITLSRIKAPQLQIYAIGEDDVIRFARSCEPPS